MALPGPPAHVRKVRPLLPFSQTACGGFFFISLEHLSLSLVLMELWIRISNDLAAQ